MHALNRSAGVKYGIGRNNVANGGREEKKSKEIRAATYGMPHINPPQRQRARFLDKGGAATIRRNGKGQQALRASYIHGFLNLQQKGTIQICA